jgi:hypothetical protein
MFMMDQKTGSSALPVLNNIEAVKLSLASRKTESSQAHSGRIQPLNRVFVIHHLTLSTAEHDN